MLRDCLFARGREFLGVETPVLCGAMTWVSNPALVSAVSNAGAFGCLAGGNTPPEILVKQVAETRSLTDKPFALNLVTVSPAYASQLVLLKELKLPYVVFAGSVPKEHEVALAKESGAKVLCFAPTMALAKRMLKFGADALVLEGMEAGGHIGHVSLMVLLQELLFEISAVPVFVAGGIATGRMCAHLLMMGAAGVQLGTRFAIAEESTVHEKFKTAFVRAKSRDAVASVQIDGRLPVVSVRALQNKGCESFSKLQLRLIQEIDAGTVTREHAQEEVEKFWMGALRRAAVEGDIENGSVMAGQSVGLVDKIMSVKEILAELTADIETELQRIKTTLA